MYNYLLMKKNVKNHEKICIFFLLALMFEDQNLPKRCPKHQNAIKINKYIVHGKESKVLKQRHNIEIIIIEDIYVVHYSYFYYYCY